MSKLQPITSPDLANHTEILENIMREMMQMRKDRTEGKREILSEIREIHGQLRKIDNRLDELNCRFGTMETRVNVLEKKKNSKTKVNVDPIVTVTEDSWDMQSHAQPISQSISPQFVQTHQHQTNMHSEQAVVIPETIPHSPSPVCGAPLANVEGKIHPHDRWDIQTSINGEMQDQSQSSNVEPNSLRCLEYVPITIEGFQKKKKVVVDVLKSESLLFRQPASVIEKLEQGSNDSPGKEHRVKEPDEALVVSQSLVPADHLGPGSQDSLWTVRCPEPFQSRGPHLGVGPEPEYVGHTPGPDRRSRKQAKLTSLWAESDSDDDCMILDPQPFTCNPSRKKEIPIVKVGSTKKPTQWVSSSFDDFADLTGNEPSQPKARKLPSQKQKALEKAVGLKRPHAAIQENGQTVLGNKPVTRRPNKDLETSLWSEKYKPITKNDLAVHKKKIEEVEAWVNDHLNRKGLPPVLLLTGPAGVGKTETIRVLAKELKCEVQEWTNPLQDTSDGYMNQEDWRSRSRLDGVSSKSHLAQFQEFLLRANKYNTLDIFGGNTFSRKLILVEEFPNMFYRDAAPFHDILRKYVQVGGSPLVFIVSDSARGESNERLLFPKDLQSHLNITNISFNPIAMTSLTKILTKIATDESLKGSHKFSVPSKSVIESIAMACAGDLRSAVNALQFACLKDTADLAAPSFCKESKGNKKSRAAGKGGKKGLSKTKSFQTDDELASIGGRDTSLFLFRALGKILYCKRDEPDPSASLPALPKHLSQHYRDPLLVNPEEVIEKSNLSGDYFSAYLHQNYPDFFTSIEDIVSASEYISDADFLTVDWASRSALQEYAASLAARGIMHSNSARARHKEGGGGMGWKPLHKPQCYTISKQYRENCESARHLFRSYRSPPVVLQTELIPYLALTNSTLHDTGQISFVQEICRFTNMKSNRYEKLDEKDVDLEDNSEATQQTVVQVDNDTEDAISDSQKNITTSQEQDEEYEIEEFDD